ncbi:phosphinothricin acetyltransferase [Enhydrobacter aerosaccus]|uniref:Phosphinothricin acetyltransferase n=1 Tax=Enhydrobacter aerosaccus TaxID=225324 RepID=A0A1T4TC84_9HYPH|nr:GNAT family N-acetyltransferase [Enhydrobacter aerosaccus]SKA38104.1 phosphinothricin acetyltransferase [Enhydrobacter aerosaccus]
MSTSSITLRDAAEADFEAITSIYGHHVRHGLASFEEEAPSHEEMLSRWRKVLDLGLPYIVAETEGRVAGYSYAGSYRPRPAYRYTVENSVYIDDAMRGRGIGKLLLAELIERCTRGPWQQMLAVIGNSGNAGSIALHRSCGFRMIGTLERVGFKHGQWVDTVLMQRTL